MGLLRRPIIALAALVVVLAVVAALAGAIYLGIFSPHPKLALDTFNGMYGTAGTRLDTCDTCHTNGRSTNTYGTHIKSEFSHMMNPGGENRTGEQDVEALRAVLLQIEESDSDDDGYSNIAEITVRSFPGDPGDHPVAGQMQAK